MAIDTQDFETKLYKKINAKEIHLLLDTNASLVKMSDGKTVENAVNDTFSIAQNALSSSEEARYISTNALENAAEGNAKASQALANLQNTDAYIESLVEEINQQKTGFLAKIAELEADIQKRGIYNTEKLITVSGTWTVPITGWYEITTIGGGAGGFVNSTRGAISGSSGEIYTQVVFLNAEDTATITIGAGGINCVNVSGAEEIVALGSITSFLCGDKIIKSSGGGINYIATGGFVDHAFTSQLNGKGWYFPGQVNINAQENYSTMRYVGFGYGGSIHNGVSGVQAMQGAIFIRYYDPDR